MFLLSALQARKAVDMTRRATTKNKICVSFLGRAMVNGFLQFLFFWAASVVFLV